MPLEIYKEMSPQEAKHQRCYWRRIGLGLFALLLVLVIVAPLAGCAGQPAKDTPWHRVCYEKPVGQTEDGTLVVLHSCVTIEEFKAAQR